MNDKHTQDSMGQGGTVRGASPKAVSGAEPEWASGLRQLYDQVVSEPLPDQFKDLLARLDEPRK